MCMKVKGKNLNVSLFNCMLNLIIHDRRAANSLTKGSNDIKGWS